jgi:hypothetical protein
MAADEAQKPIEPQIDIHFKTRSREDLAADKRRYTQTSKIKLNGRI